MQTPTCIQNGNVFQAAIAYPDGRVEAIKSDQDQPAFFQTAQAAEQYAARQIVDAPKERKKYAAFVLVLTIISSVFTLYLVGVSGPTLVVCGLVIAYVGLIVGMVWRQANADLRMLSAHPFA